MDGVAHAGRYRKCVARPNRKASHWFGTMISTERRRIAVLGFRRSIPERIFGPTGGSLLGLVGNSSDAAGLPAAPAPVAVLLRYSLDRPAQ